MWKVGELPLLTSGCGGRGCVGTMCGGVAVDPHTCWCFRSISSSSPSTFVCFSFTFSSSSSFAWSSSSWRVTWRRGFTCDRQRVGHYSSPHCHAGRPPQDEGWSRPAHLREDTPPLPVPQLQVRRTVPLQDLQGTQLLLLLGKGPEGQEGECTLTGVQCEGTRGPPGPWLKQTAPPPMLAPCAVWAACLFFQKPLPWACTVLKDVRPMLVSCSLAPRTHTQHPPQACMCIREDVRLLSGEVASAHSLEKDDDVRDL